MSIKIMFEYALRHDTCANSVRDQAALLLTTSCAMRTMRFLETKKISFRLIKLSMPVMFWLPLRRYTPWHSCNQASLFSFLILHLALSGKAFALPLGYTGSLLSPAGALYREGSLNVEPYLIYADQTGIYASNGKKKSGELMGIASNHTLIKYAVSRTFSLRTVVSSGVEIINGKRVSAWQINDLPLEGIWRFHTGQNDQLVPDGNLFLGVSFPCGQTRHLTPQESAFGSGQYEFRTGLTFQRVYFSHRTNSIRLREWFALRQPIGSSRKDISSSLPQLSRVKTFAYGEAGISAEINAGPRWLFSIDFAGYLSAGSLAYDRTSNIDASRSTAGYRYLQAAPALEYNMSNHLGIICGMPATFLESNTRGTITGECAFNAAL
ncbi:hypothetical protein [Gluconacetobacter diazotrophicus]|uniref:hypothetical protein n=1 Tax=Gluconacetobacter diazotrophicus TaxID=33996 RepID=UPI00119AAFE2|nr:hypothetical protein [Gluconacetobacter diazotrophicus]TWB00729.1 hypothetical protein FBZ86_1339 [Gluconacetobacter diazotrophicus]